MATFFYAQVLATAQTLTEEFNTSELSQDTNTATAQGYLKQDRQNLTSACIENAIAIIRKERYTPAIPVLVKYLDFKIYAMPRVIYDPKRPTIGLYPAVDALARFEDSAIPALKGAVQDEDLDKVGRLNASCTIPRCEEQAGANSIYGQTARSSLYPDIAEALTKLAGKWVQYCVPTERQQCSDAVNTQ